MNIQEYDKTNAQVLKVLRPLHNRQTKILFKRIQLEQKLEKTNETIMAIRKLYDEKNDLFNKRTNEEYKMSPPNTLKVKVTQTEFLQMWVKYKNDPSVEKQFLTHSKEYAKYLSEINTNKIKIRNSKKIQTYHKMLHHNYLQRSALEDRFLENIA